MGLGKQLNRLDMWMFSHTHTNSWHMDSIIGWDEYLMIMVNAGEAFAACWLLYPFVNEPDCHSYTPGLLFSLCTSLCERYHEMRGRSWSNQNEMISSQRVRLGSILCFTKGGKAFFTCFGTFSSARLSSGKYHQVRDQKLRFAIRSILQDTDQCGKSYCCLCIWLWIRKQASQAIRHRYIKGLL